MVCCQVTLASGTLTELARLREENQKLEAEVQLWKDIRHQNRPISYRFRPISTEFSSET